jgi:hypothetical protein
MKAFSPIMFVSLKVAFLSAVCCSQTLNQANSTVTVNGITMLNFAKVNLTGVDGHPPYQTMAWSSTGAYNVTFDLGSTACSQLVQID